MYVNNTVNTDACFRFCLYPVNGEPYMPLRVCLHT